MLLGLIPLIWGIILMNFWYYLQRDFFLLSIGILCISVGIAMLAREK